MKKTTTYFGILCLLISTTLFAQDAFITTWTTNASGASSTITIPANGTGYNYDVDWENDGIYDDFAVTGSLTHDYGVEGTYTVAIKGAFPKIDMSTSTDKLKLKSIDQWGTQQWTAMAHSFENCSNLIITATDSPDLSLVTDMSYMFSGAESFNQDINNWNVTNVTNMEGLFKNASIFNQPIENWDVSHVTNMSYMFRSTIFNQPIGNWNVSHVTNMSYMFIASNFNLPIGNWDVSSVTNMSFMFTVAQFNQPIGNWDVSSVTNMFKMFASAISFNQPIGNWDVSKVTNMQSMFSTSYFNQPIDNWNVSNVTNMRQVFGQTRTFNQPINSWDVSSVTDMSGMFNSSWAFNQPIGNWDVSKVTDMSKMFSSSKMFNQPIGNWDVSNVTDMNEMFRSAERFNQPLGNWNVSNVTIMSNMFRETNFNQSIGNWDISNVTLMNLMFHSTTLSTNNYDDILTKWALLPLKNNVNFFVGNSTYCNGANARQSIIDNFGWVIVDAGLDCSNLSVSNFNDANITLFPNPVTSSFTIQGIENNIYNVQILNLQGQIVKEILNYNLEPISINSLANGVYFVKINAYNTSKTIKVVKAN